MTKCDRENELLDALERGYVGAELQTHVASCAGCRELQTVAGALLDDRAAAIGESRVPAAGTMLFRLRLRARQDAQATARRALVAGQVATLVVALTLVVTFFGREALDFVHVFSAIHFSASPLIVLAMCLLAAPVAGWAAVRK
jgi:hypothetical protein